MRRYTSHANFLRVAAESGKPEVKPMMRPVEAAGRYK
jgi:hypothetical protein